MDLTIDAVTDGSLSANDLKALLDGSTYASLLVQYESAVVPLKAIADDLFGIPYERARTRANSNGLPVPTFKLAGPRSPWLIHVRDLAELIDSQHAAAIEAITEARADTHQEATA